MMKAKSTKRALLMSALALLCCVSMFVGTTFAWFTDSVTSGKNTIQSGNLDVELYYSKTAAGPWDKVTATTDVFGYADWEPGHTRVAYFKVVNEGSLALKYQLTADVYDEQPGKNKDGETFWLSDSLYTKVVEAGATREEILASTDGVKLKNSIAMSERSLLEDEEKIIGLAIWMPTTVGNEANHDGTNVPKIDFGINLIATQFTKESDSFDEKYDDIALVSDADDLTDAIAAGKDVMLSADVVIDDDRTITIPADTAILMDLNGNTLSGKSSKSGNAEMFLVKGELSVFNGTVEMSTTNNQGWNAMTAVFDVTAGGVLNVNDATINNLGGTDMAFCVHMNNWGEVTLNVDNSTLSSNYCAVRVFNSGNDMNNVTITNSNLIATRALWVHNYSAADFGDNADKAAAAAARLNMNVLIENPVAGLAADDASNLNAAANNTIVGSVSYGFTNRVTYYSTSNAVVATSNEKLDSAIANGAKTIYLSSGNYIIPDSAQGKTLTIVGNGDTVVATQDDGSYEGCDYSLDGATVTFENITINTDSSTYTGYARCKGTYNNCTINGTYTLYGDSVFNDCTFNVSGDVYNLWTWGAPNATFNNCTFNSDGKALLLYGTENTNLTVNGCVFNDNGGLSDLKAAIEIGNDYGKTYTVTVNNTVVNGYEINDKGISTNTTLWANKNSMGTDKLNVVVDGVDVY